MKETWGGMLSRGQPVISSINLSHCYGNCVVLVGMVEDDRVTYIITEERLPWGGEEGNNIVVHVSVTATYFTL